MKNRVTKKKIVKVTDVENVLLKSRRIFSSAYNSQEGEKNKYYALIARETFDDLVLSGQISPETAHKTLNDQKKVDFLLERARAKEEEVKDSKLDKSLSIVNGNIELLKSENNEQSLRIKELLAINEEQSGSIAELASNNKELIALANEAKQDAIVSKAELQATRAELKDNEKKNKRSNFIYFAAGALVSAALTFLPMTIKKDDLPVKPVTQPKPQGVLIYRPTVTVHNHNYFTNPIASGDAPKKDNGLLYNSEGKPVLVPQGKKRRPAGFTPN